MTINKHPQQLLNLAAFENQIKDFQVSNSAQVAVCIDAKNSSIQIQCNGFIFQSQVNRPLVHQLGSRAFPQLNTYPEISKKWNELFLLNKPVLENIIADVLKKHEMVIRYYVENGVNKIYGIVTTMFNKISPLHFREQFLKEAIKTGALDLNSETTVNQYGQIIEKFDCYFEDEEIKFSYLLNHARNNGYNAVQVMFGREVIICSNGLTKLIGEDFKWRHTSKQKVSDFIALTLDRGIKLQQTTQSNIVKARNRMLSRTTFNEFMQKLELASVSKERIVNQLKVEINKEGANEWALSQSLTWLGTHESALSSHPKALLTRAGSRILDYSLKEYS